jgi:hypothetical protein
VFGHELEHECVRELDLDGLMCVLDGFGRDVCVGSIRVIVLDLVSFV